MLLHHTLSQVFCPTHCSLGFPNLGDELRAREKFCGVRCVKSWRAWSPIPVALGLYHFLSNQDISFPENPVIPSPPSSPDTSNDEEFFDIAEDAV